MAEVATATTTANIQACDPATNLRNRCQPMAVFSGDEGLSRCLKGHSGVMPRKLSSNTV